MDNLFTIKNRIANIKATQKIIQSMRLMSSVKAQKVRVKMTNNRFYWNEAVKLVNTARNGIFGRHPYIGGRGVKSPAVIVINGDRGLCGGYNINAGKALTAFLDEWGGARIVTVGTKARDYCRRRHGELTEHSFTGISENPFYDDAERIASIVLDWYDKKEIDQIHIIYTEFRNMLSQTVRTVRLLPFEAAEYAADGRLKCEIPNRVFFESTVPFYMAAYIYGAVVESSVCEQSARIASMDSAVRNADDMVEALTLRYNQERQSAITQELIEIVNGGEAVS